MPAFPKASRPKGNVTIVVRPRACGDPGEARQGRAQGDAGDYRLFRYRYAFFTVKLASGPHFIIRQQNRHGAKDDFKTGMPVGVEIGAKCSPGSEGLTVPLDASSLPSRAGKAAESIP